MVEKSLPELDGKFKIITFDPLSFKIRYEVPIIYLICQEDGSAPILRHQLLYSDILKSYLEIFYLAGRFKPNWT